MKPFYLVVFFFLPLRHAPFVFYTPTNSVETEYLTCTVNSLKQTVSDPLTTEKSEFLKNR